MQREADLGVAFAMLFLHVRGGYTLAANVEAYQVEQLSGTGVSAPLIAQMAREIVAVQNGVL